MKHISKFALAFAVVASPPLCAQTSSTTPVPLASASASYVPDLAYGAYQRGYYVTAFREAMARVKANEQDAPAMTLIGQLYSEGLTVKRDPTEAARWFKLASDRGDRQATFQLAVAAMEGSGIAKDKAYAKQLFEKAAAQGHPGALYNLGVMAVENNGVVPDFANLAEGDTRARHPRFAGDNFQKNRALVERVEAIAADKRCTVAQLCLAWLLAQGPDVIPIPGTKRIERLQENLGALQVRLTPEEAKTVSEVIPVGAAAGTRYPEGGMKGVYI